MADTRIDLNGDGEQIPLLSRVRSGFSYSQITACVRNAQTSMSHEATNLKDVMVRYTIQAKNSVVEGATNTAHSIARQKELFQVIDSTVKQTLGAINTLALVDALVPVAEAFPNNFPNVYRVLIWAGIPLSIAQLAIHSAAARKLEIKFQNHTVKFEDILHYLSGLITGANTFNFTLAFVVTLVILGIAAINNLGENQVDVKDIIFYLAIVLPSAVVGLTHTLLEWFKESWSKSDSKTAHIVSMVEKAVRTLYYSSNINSFMELCGVKEGGVNSKINPYDRLGLIGIAGGIGVLLTIIGSNLPVTDKYINTLIDTMCAISYLASILSLSSTEILGTNLTYTFIGAFAAMFLTSLTMNILMPPTVSPPAGVSPLLQNSVFSSTNTTPSVPGHDPEALTLSLN